VSASDCFGVTSCDRMSHWYFKLCCCISCVSLYIAGPIRDRKYIAVLY